MILYSTDIETTGVDPETSQILSLGIAELDTKIGLTGRTLNILFPREQLEGTPYAINMNANLIKLNRDYFMQKNAEERRELLAKHGFDYAVEQVAGPHYADYNRENFVHYYLHEIFADFTKDVKVVNCLGKNFGKFDLQYLNLTNIFRSVKVSNRSADIAVFFQTLEDEQLPSMSQCMERSKIDFPAGVTHDGLQDAKDTALLYMEGLTRLIKYT